MNQLDMLMGIIPILDAILNEEDAMVTVFNTEESVYYRPGKTIDIGRLGSKVEQGDGIYECIQSGKIMRHFVPKEAHGVPFRGLIIPLKGEKNVIDGCIAIGWSLSQREKVTSVGESLTSFVDKIVGATEGITVNSQLIAISHEKMLSTVTETENTFNSTMLITNIIKKIANQSTVLALNGSIEAARAGAHGKSFAVVANEMHRLAKDTEDSVVRIDKSLVELKDSVSHILKQIEQNEEMIQSQATTTSEIHQSISEMKHTLENLLSMANEL